MHAVCIHSKYAPQKEAVQFVQRINGNPAIIVVTEPGDSYLVEPLRTHFPLAVLIAVRYSDTYFLDSDPLWDAVWRPSSGSLPFFLHNHIADEQLAATQFLAWKPSDRAFPHEAEAVWKDIRYTIDMITSIMYTRSFFGNRWLKNTVKNFIYLHNRAGIAFGTQPIVLAGAGPSLTALETAALKHTAVCAVSSALTSLRYKKRDINLCISTDAGYWALRHFDGLSSSVPVAFPLEAAIPSRILAHNPCVPLSYHSPLEQELFRRAGWEELRAKENGTVMGTAVDLLLDNTEIPVCIAGLDLAATKGFAHAQPHSSTLFADQATDKLNPLAETCAVQNFNTQSLNVYRTWFLQFPASKKKRVYYLGNTLLAATNSIPPPFEVHGTAKHGKKLCVYTLPTPCSCTDRKDIVRTVLTTVQAQLNKPDTFKGLLNVPDSLERQLCALCAYADYCTYVKNQRDGAAREALLKKVNTMINFLVQRLHGDEL
ncbi:MAG: 6-hydroxymethylpterin diphosphokinase MptE-like protein [Treponema sp.]